MTAPPQRIGLVTNPTAGKGHGRSAGARLRTLLTGDDIVDLSAHDAPTALDRARAAVAAGALDVLAVVGGDGMAHLGVNACAGSETPLAIVPVGTGNDIARCLGVPPMDVEAAARAIGARHTCAIDAGRIDPATPDGAPAKWFGGTLYAGFDALVNARANSWRWPPGQARYTLATLRELPVFRPIPYAVTVDGARIETEAMLVVVANVDAYGGGMRVAPNARPDDGMFDVLILHRIPRTEFLRVFPKVFSGRHIGHPAVQVIRGRHVRLEADGIPGFADGEPFTSLPVTVTAVPRALQVVVP